MPRSRASTEIFWIRIWKGVLPVIALGGGITGDVAGFVAATYLRGVPFIQCPTTLLAMVDSSVGGKTGVNVPQGKNLVGAFYQPALVVADPLVLQSLPARELQCGLAECIKHAVIRDESLFGFISENLASILNLSAPEIVELVRRNVEIKAAVVMEDEKEHGVRAHLNFGHTFGHAIEATGAMARFSMERPWVWGCWPLLGLPQISDCALKISQATWGNS